MKRNVDQTKCRHEWITRDVVVKKKTKRVTYCCKCILTKKPDSMGERNTAMQSSEVKKKGKVKEPKVPKPVYLGEDEFEI